jgi:hypothetical protein
MIMLNNRPAQDEIAYGDRAPTTNEAARSVKPEGSAETWVVKATPPKGADSIVQDRGLPGDSSLHPMNQSFSTTGQFSGGASPAGSDALDASASDNSRYAVVTLDVTRTAADEPKLKQLLKKHKIDAGKNIAQAGKQRAADGSSAPPASKVLQRWVQKEGKTGQSDVVYLLVEVSPEQLQGTVADLRANTEWCRDVELLETALETANHKQPESPKLDRSQKLEAPPRAAELTRSGKTGDAEKAIPAPSPPPTPTIAPTAEPPAALNDRQGAGGLLEPKPSEIDPPPGRNLPPSSAEAPSDNAKPAESQVAKPMDPANELKIGAKAPPDEQAAPRADAARASQVRVLFVLRTVEPPAEAAPMTPASPK